jgi:hypothetical protein
LEFVDTNGTEAVRRDNLHFQIPGSNSWKIKLLIGVFKKAHVLCLKSADGLEFSSSRVIASQQFKLFQIPALGAKNQYLKGIKGRWPILFKPVNGPTANNTYVDILPSRLIAVDGRKPPIVSGNNNVATVLWRK